MAGLSFSYINWKLAVEGATRVTEDVILAFLDNAPNVAAVAETDEWRCAQVRLQTHLVHGMHSDIWRGKCQLTGLGDVIFAANATDANAVAGRLVRNLRKSPKKNLEEGSADERLFSLSKSTKREPALLMERLRCATSGSRSLFRTARSPARSTSWCTGWRRRRQKRGRSSRSLGVRCWQGVQPLSAQPSPSHG